MTEPQSAPLPDATPEHGSEAPVPGAEWRKLHPLTPIIDGGVVLLVIVGILVANLRDVIINMFIGDRWGSQWESENFDEDDFDEWNLWQVLVEEGVLIWVILGILGVILLGLGIAWLSWFFHSFTITNQAVEMKKGVVFKQHRRAPLDRIQSVNLKRSLIARIFGLTSVEVLTAGQGGRLNLSYLTNNDAKQVRQQILRTAQDAADGTATDYRGRSYGEASTELDRRAQDFLDFDIDAEEGTKETLVRVPSGRLLGSILLSHESIFFILLILAIPFMAIEFGAITLTGLIPGVIALVGISIARFNRGFNFVLSATSDGIRTGSGLTSTSTNTIPGHRIHAVDISQPIGWRPFGWWWIRLTIAGASIPSGSSQSMFESVILPVGKREDVLKVLALIYPHLDTPAENHWLLDALEGPGTGFTKAGAKSSLLLLFARKRTGITVAHPGTYEEAVRIRRGAVTRKLVMMSVVRTQSVLLHRPAVHRWLGLASLTLHTVLGPVSVYMRGLALEDARKWWEYLSRSIVEAQLVDQTRPWLDQQIVEDPPSHAPTEAVTEMGESDGR